MVNNHKYNTRYKANDKSVQNIYLITGEVSPKKSSKKNEKKIIAKEPKNSNNHDDDNNDDDDHDDDGDGLVVDQFNSAVATVEVEGHEEEGDDHDDHGDEHGNALHVEGVSAGTTSFKLQLMHDGHADYTSTNNVPVTVN